MTAEITEAKELVRKYFADPDEPLEDDWWSLDVEIVEFEHGGRVATI